MGRGRVLITLPSGVSTRMDPRVFFPNSNAPTAMRLPEVDQEGKVLKPLIPDSWRKMTLSPLPSAFASSN